MRTSDPRAPALLSPATRLGSLACVCSGVPSPQPSPRGRGSNAGANSLRVNVSRSISYPARVPRSLSLWERAGVRAPPPTNQPEKTSPCRHSLASSAGAPGSGTRMSESRAADKFVRTPGDPSNAACPKRSEGPANSARLSFAYFSLAKQRKVSRPPGRDPASNRSQPAATKKIRSESPASSAA